MLVCRAQAVGCELPMHAAFVSRRSGSHRESRAAPLQQSSPQAPRPEAVHAAQVRHGAVLGLAEVVQALADLGHKPAERVQADLAQLPQRIVGAKLLRGKGGDIMRAAYCRWLPPLLCPCGARHLLGNRCHVSSTVLWVFKAAGRLVAPCKPVVS